MTKEKFFKINLDKLLEQIPMVNQLDLKLNPSQWGMIEGLEDHRYWVHISARRTGKSYAAALLAFAKIVKAVSVSKLNSLLETCIILIYQKVI